MARGRAGCSAPFSSLLTAAGNLRQFVRWECEFVLAVYFVRKRSRSRNQSLGAFKVTMEGLEQRLSVNLEVIPHRSHRHLSLHPTEFRRHFSYFGRGDGFGRTAAVGKSKAARNRNSYRRCTCSMLADMSGRSERQGEQAQAGNVGAARTISGSINALIVSYYRSPEYRGLKASTQAVRKRIIEAIRLEHGEKPVARLGKVH